MFLIATPLGVVAWVIGTIAPSTNAKILDAPWVWTVIASAGLALVYGLRTCGIRYRHPTDPGIGGGASIVVAVVLSASLAGAIVLGSRPSGFLFTFVGLGVGAFLAAVAEALIRGPRGIGLRVARVPLGYERDLVFTPVNDDPRGDRWVIQIERRSHLDPLYRPVPGNVDARTTTLLPHPDVVRETYECDPVDGDGIDTIARAIIFAF